GSPPAALGARGRSAGLEVRLHHSWDVLVVELAVGPQGALHLADRIEAFGGQRPEEPGGARFIGRLPNDTGEPNRGVERWAALATDEPRDGRDVDAGPVGELSQLHPARAELERQPVPELDLV